MFKLIKTGCFYADGGGMFGATPKVSWNRNYPANERNLCVLAMNTGVIKTDSGRVIIVDPGVSQDSLKDTPAVYYQFYDTVDILDELQKLGIAAADVTDVVFTHLHFDHCGAAVRRNADGKPELTFPNAAHWASRAQYDSERNPHPLEAESFLPQNTKFIEQAGALRLIESTVEPFGEMRLEIYDGHTLGQIAAYVKDGDETILFPGDIIPLVSQIVPERISAYDYFPTLSYNGKVKILERAAATDETVVFYHDAYTPAAKIKKVGKSFKQI